MANGKILVVTTKKYEMPNDELYLPIQVGALGKESIGYIRDDGGDNISQKNPYYCELTALYYAYKNMQVDYLGLFHYRRYLKGDMPFLVNGKKKKIISKSQVEKYLGSADIILPKKRNYYIETLYSHYEHTMYVEPLDMAGEIIKNTCKEYYSEFENLKKRKSAHMFNMFIAKKSVIDGYCDWLFPILFELEKVVDVSKYDSFHARFFGRISELLFDVYLITNKISYKEVGLCSLEKVNWLKKGWKFLRAKFSKEKYDKSF